jgi:hypothetical protein
MPPFLYTINDDTTYDSYTENESINSDSGETYSFGKNNIVLCELFNPYIHGFTNESDRNVLCHYLVIGKYSTIYSPCIYEDINHVYENMDRLFLLDPRFCRHPRIRNYKNIASKIDYIRPEIAECIYLSGDECVAVLKTFWLRLVQRTWKRVFQERCRMIETGINTDSIVLPSIRGMIKKSFIF